MMKKLNRSTNEQMQIRSHSAEMDGAIKQTAQNTKRSSFKSYRFYPKSLLICALLVASITSFSSLNVAATCGDFGGGSNNGFYGFDGSGGGSNNGFGDFGGSNNGFGDFGGSNNGFGDFGGSNNGFDASGGNSNNGFDGSGGSGGCNGSGDSAGCNGSGDSAGCNGSGGSTGNNGSGGSTGNDQPSQDTQGSLTNQNQPETNPSVESSQDSNFEQQAIDLVNKHRSDRGLKLYQLDSELNRFSAFKAKDMTDNNYFSHESPVHGSPWDLADKLGVKGVSGEVIARTGDPNPATVIDMWMNSPGHYAILMHAEYTKFGIGRSGENFAAVAG